MPLSISSTTPISNLFIDPVTEHINAYIAAHTVLIQAGWDTFIADRRDIRTAYCNAIVSPEALKTWISNLSAGEAVQNEFTHRFQQWDAKIAKRIGGITKSKTPALSEDEFFKKLQAFYDKHEDLLNSSAFANFNKVKAILRTDLLPELKKDTIDTVAKRHNITYKELINRMTHEWKWKAETSWIV